MAKSCLALVCNLGTKNTRALPHDACAVGTHALLQQVRALPVRSTLAGSAALNARAVRVSDVRQEPAFNAQVRTRATLLFLPSLALFPALTFCRRPGQSPCSSWWACDQPSPMLACACTHILMQLEELPGYTSKSFLAVPVYLPRTAGMAAAAATASATPARGTSASGAGGASGGGAAGATGANIVPSNVIAVIVATNKWVTCSHAQGSS